MNFLTPLTEFEKRTGRRRNDVVADGEHVRFDIMLMDGRSKPATEQIADQRIKAQVDREHAAHDHKFSFMGDAAPKFDRERAEFLARSRHSTGSGSLLRDAVRDGRYASHNGITVAGQVPADTSIAEPSIQLRDQLRAARYAR